MNKKSIKENSNLNLSKLKTLNTEKGQIKEIFYIKNIQNEQNFYKLTNNAFNVENSAIYHYNNLKCPICMERNAINSLLFKNLKEFILYLGYIFIFEPQPFEKCKFFFENKNQIINYFNITSYEKSFFKNKNPILMCKNCLYNKLNDKNFIYIFSSIFGCKEITNNITIKKEINKNPKNIKKIRNDEYIKKDLEIEIKNENKTTENNDNKKEENNKINSLNIDNQLFKDSNLTKLIDNFENRFNLIFQYISKIIFEMRKYNISISEGKAKNKKEKYLNKLNELKTGFNIQYKEFSNLQLNYSNEILNLNYILKNTKNILQIKEMNYIKYESISLSQKINSYLLFFQSILKEYIKENK